MAVMALGAPNRVHRQRYCAEVALAAQQGHGRVAQGRGGPVDHLAGAPLQCQEKYFPAGLNARQSSTGIQPRDTGARRRSSGSFRIRPFPLGRRRSSERPEDRSEIIR